jgi:pimeloyl-ACP methyl ester carboxylesterase
MMEERRLESYDGTEICYYVTEDRPVTVVLANGLGGAVVSWKHLVERMRDRVRFVSWDYRGLFNSKRPKDIADLAIEDHIKDLELILNKENVDKAVFAGWSMGVQVVLENYRTMSDKYLGMILLNGTYASPFKTAFGWKHSGKVFPIFNEIALKINPVLPTLLSRVVHSNWLLPAVQKLGLVDKGVDQEIFREVTHKFATLDFEVYFEMFKHLDSHDADDVLDGIKVPVLIIAGTKDAMTPQVVTDHMGQKMPNAEVFNVENGSHYSILEYPELIVDKMEEYFIKNILKKESKPVVARKKPRAAARKPGKKPAK